MSDKPPFRISPPLAALCLFVVVAIGFGIWFALQQAQPPLEISEQTTVVVTPLDERGRIDYETPLNDVLARGVKPESNAMVALTRVLGPRPEGGRGMPADWWKRIGAEEPPEEGEYLLDNTIKFFDGHLQADDQNITQDRRRALEEEETRLRIEPWTTKDSPHYVEWLKANDKPLSLVAEAVKLPHYFHPLIARDQYGAKQDLIASLLPYCQKMRSIANMLSIRAMWHLGEGRADAAWADLMTIYRLGGLMTQNPNSLIEYLVGVALRTIAMARMVKVIEVAKPDFARLTSWKKEFQVPVSPNWEKLVGVYERYCGLDALLSIKESLENPNKPLGGVIYDADKSFDLIRRNRTSIDWNDVLKTYNEHYDELTKQVVLMTYLNATHEQRASAIVALNDLERSLDPSTAANTSQQLTRTILKLFLPAIQKIAVSSIRLQQHTVLLDLMFQLEVHRLKLNNYPDTLDNMYREENPFLPPIDYFTGEPIRYKRLPNGYYLHSVGQNKKDDFNEQFDEPHHGDDVVVKVIRK